MKVRFGSFTFDGGRQQVLDADRVVPLSPKAFAVLELLLERRPDVIDKETLMARVWFGAHVTDASLSMAIAEIRKALGDSAETPRYIRTAHRRGYAFCGEASGVEPGRTPAAAVFWVVVNGVRTLLGPGETTVGRDPASGIWLDVPSVSWRHARILVDGRTAQVEDLGSTNGTYVGRRRVTAPSALRHGDALVFGDVRATFGTSAEPSARTERLP
jgi:DNA-binding winged helix-turn-helix (wHTH) protein